MEETRKGRKEGRKGYNDNGRKEGGIPRKGVGGRKEG